MFIANSLLRYTLPVWYVCYFHVYSNLHWFLFNLFLMTGSLFHCLTFSLIFAYSHPIVSNDRNSPVVNYSIFDSSRSASAFESSRFSKSSGWPTEKQSFKRFDIHLRRISPHRPRWLQWKSRFSTPKKHWSLLPLLPTNHSVTASLSVLIRRKR